MIIELSNFPALRENIRIKYMKINFDLLTIFPECLASYFSSSILARAQKNNLIKITTHDIREQADNKHNRVDEPPYGGGPGMVIQIEPVYKTLKKVYSRKNNATRVILMSPQGKTFDQNEAKRLAKYKRLILIAGHYEAIDARIDHFVDEKISLGNFILTGGELAATCVVDSVARLLPGVVGKEASIKDESFSEFDKNSGQFNIEYPQYTRPEKFKSYSVPAVLLSGHHGQIKEWRAKQTGRR